LKGRKEEMANNLVLDTLREHRQEIGEERQQASVLVAQCREEIEHRRASLKNTQEQAECAADEADISYHQQQGLREAESRLAVAERNFTLIQKSLQEITEDIQRVQRGH
jgi:hypothetical protein